MKRMGLVIFGLPLVAWIFFPEVSLADNQAEIAQLKEKIIHIQNEGKLGFRHFTMCANITGYGRYTPLKENKVPAGSVVQIYFEPVNLFTRRQNGIYHVWYTQDILLRTDTGKEIYTAKELIDFNYQSVSPVLDYYATNSVDLGDLPPGRYVFVAVLHDKLKNDEATYSIVFEVVGKEPDDQTQDAPYGR